MERWKMKGMKIIKRYGMIKKGENIVIVVEE